jgi:hypothetical protein
VAFSITLISIIKLFLNRSVQNLHLAAFRSDRISISQILRDGGFEQIRFLRFLTAKSGINAPISSLSMSPARHRSESQIF